MKRSWIVVVAVCLAFGLRALLLIDATALWSDELYSVGKSFQPSFSHSSSHDCIGAGRSSKDIS